MKLDQNLLIEELLSSTKETLHLVEQFKSLSLDKLNYKTSPQTWSILECIEHLNLYGKFYLPEIESQLLKANRINKKEIFKSGFWGDYFISLIKTSNTKKFKAVKAMDSTGARLSVATLDQFIKQQEVLVSLLNKSRNVNLNKTKTAISLTKLLRLRLGDTLRFLVYHNERHVLQAKRIKVNACNS